MSAVCARLLKRRGSRDCAWPHALPLPLPLLLPLLLPLCLCLGVKLAGCHAEHVRVEGGHG